MRRWLSTFCVKVPRSSRRTHIRPDTKETRDSMADPQSSSGNTDGSERITEMIVDSQSGHPNNIILNHDFSGGLYSWHANSCHAYVASGESGFLNGVKANSGGDYAVVTKRTECWQGLEQDITGKVSSGTTYTVSACVRVWGDFQGTAGVQATLRLEYPNSATSYLSVGRTVVTKERWEKLEGSFSLSSMPKRVIFYLEGPPPGVDLLIDSITILSSDLKQFGEPRTRCIADGDENIIQNPRFEDGLNNWSGRGCKILVHDSMGDGKILPLSGKYFASATERSQSWNGIQQEITSRVQRKLAYEVTAVVRIFGSATSVDVRATLWVQTPNGREQYIGIANLQASDKEWVQLQGKFLLNGVASRAVIYIEGPPAGADILVNSLVVKHAEKLPPSPSPDFENVLFGVNIIENSNLSDGLNGWYPLGPCTLSISAGSPHVLPPMARDSLGPHEPLNGHYILITNRTQSWMGPAQTITDKLKLNLTYQISAWVRVGSGRNGPQNINVALGVDSQWVNGGQAEANDDRWHEIGGSFRIEKQPSKVIVYIQGPSSGVDLMVAGLQIFPVDRKARFKHLKKQTDKVRKRDVVLKFSGSDFGDLFGTFVKVGQTQNSFPFGSCISRTNIDNEDFVDFFVKNFNWGVFGNELKWYWTETQQGTLNYTDADELLDLCNKHGIETRGHCIFWEVEGTVQSWVRSLNKNDLMTAVQNRLTGLLSRYKDKFRHYDVNNEMLHGSFYQDRLGNDIRSFMFKTAHQLDPSPTLFVNDYHVEDGLDTRASPEMYTQQILGLQEQGAPVGGIGIQGHIDNPVGPIVCSALDTLGILGLPIWFTELDVSAANEYIRADDLEVMLREAYAHPAVEGVMLWGFWELFMSRENAHLVDAEGNANEAGKRYLALKQEWLSHAHGHIDDQQEFKFRGFHGTYSVEIFTLTEKFSQTFIVDKGDSPLVNVSYGANILENSTFNDGLSWWHPLGSCTLSICTGSPHLLPSVARDSLGHHQPLSGRYILATNRTETWMGPSQTITDKLKLHLTYQVAAWVRVGPGAKGPQNINVALGVDNQWVNGGQVEAIDDRWHELGGSFRLEKQPSKVIVYVQGPLPGVDLMVAGFQIFPVDRKGRFEYLKKQTDKVRRRDIVLIFQGPDYANLRGMSVKVRQIQNSFPFGSCISRSNIENEEFIDFFVKNFNWAVFGNELKWYSTEQQQGKLNYKDADELLNFCERHGIETRGHCIFWEVDDVIQPWIRSLNRNDLMTAVQNRIKGLLSRYRGRFRHYDVNNEMLHGSFYQDRLGKEIRAYMFKEAHRLDPSSTLFVNDYHVEDGCDSRSSPEMYIHHILDLQEQGAPVGGIGIQGHIDHPVGAVICSALDKLAILGLPIWFTELDVSAVNEHVRADDLEVMLREVYAHPAVEGIVLWGFWELFMCRDNSHLVDATGKINEAGKRYLALKEEWLAHADGHVDARGEFQFRGYQGTYSVEISTPGKKLYQTFVVNKGEFPLMLTINV